MKTFHCTHCQSLVFFENVTCLTCGNSLAYVPERVSTVALRQEPDGAWKATKAGANDPAYRLCVNYPKGVCNWANPAAAGDALCPSCRLTRIIPNLSKPENQLAWAKLEAAKRRMVYTVLGLGLQPVPKAAEPWNRLAFEFLRTRPRVIRVGSLPDTTTGSSSSISRKPTTSNARSSVCDSTSRIAPSLGHFRHEIGHHYLDRARIAGTPQLDGFRDLFWRCSVPTTNRHLNKH